MQDTITVRKETDPAGGSGFNFSGDLGSFTLDDGGSQTFDGLVAGVYDVSEVVPDGWSLEGVVCTGGESESIADGVRIHLGAGEAILCTFTNVQYRYYIPLILLN